MMHDTKRMSFGFLPGRDVSQKQRNEVKSNKTPRSTESKSYRLLHPRKRLSKDEGEVKILQMYKSRETLASYLACIAVGGVTPGDHENLQENLPWRNETFHSHSP